MRLANRGISFQSPETSIEQKDGFNSTQKPAGGKGLIGELFYLWRKQILEGTEM